MGEQAVAAKAGMRRPGRREGIAAEHLATEFKKLPGRRQPAQLHAVVVVLVVEEDTIGQRLVGEVPGVGVLLVEVADPREKPPGAQGQAPRQAGGLEERLLD